MAQPIEKASEAFDDTPEGWAERWQVEFDAADKELESFHKTGDNIVKKLRAKSVKDDDEGPIKLHLFAANVQTLRSMLYGQTPKVDVSRRFADSQDDEARVAAEMLERVLNNDIVKDSDPYCVALQYALDDRLGPGLGTVRIRFEADFNGPEEVGETAEDDTDEMAPPEPTVRPGSEQVLTEYVYWKDVKWSPARTYSEQRWRAYRAFMTREALVSRFGEEIGNAVPLNAKTGRGKRNDGDSMQADPWGRAEVWEIWNKEDRKVYWWVKGFDKILDVQDDLLGLDGFWPEPRPMMANLTTTAMVPVADYKYAEDLYVSCNVLASRIDALTDAVRVVGIYNKDADGVGTMLTEGMENTLIPVDNWALWAEKGGIKGQIEWFPLEQVVQAIDKLTTKLNEKMMLLYQITGMSDILRGQSAAGATATEQKLKARYGSIRIQILQEEFARFASDVQRLKAEAISKLMSPETIIERSNVMRTYDAPMAEKAVALIKSRFWDLRIEVKPEAVSLADYAVLKQERSEFLTAFATFMQSAAPILTAQPASAPFLLEILKWTLAGFQGGSTIENVLDQAISAAQQGALMPKQGPTGPDPKLVTQQMKGQQDMQKIQGELQADLVRIDAETRAEVAKQAAQAKFNIMEEFAKPQAPPPMLPGRVGQGVSKNGRRPSPPSR